MALRNLPQTGTYTLVMDPVGQQTMSFNVAASQAVTGTLTAGTPQSVTLSQPGRYAVLSFTATAGETVALTFGSITTSPASQSVSVTVYNSSGTQVTGANSTTGTTLNMTNLSAGTYTVVVIPNYAATASLQVSYQ
jgi:hypothetical protein